MLVYNIGYCASVYQSDFLAHTSNTELVQYCASTWFGSCRISNRDLSSAAYPLSLAVRLVLLCVPVPTPRSAAKLLSAARTAEARSLSAAAAVELEVVRVEYAPPGLYSGGATPAAA